MAKKAANPAPVASEKVSEEVVTSTVPETVETPETEATTSPAIDQPAVTDDASASSSDPVSDPASKDDASEEGATEAPSSPAEPVIPEAAEPVAEHKGGGGSFESPFAEPKPALTMVERIELLEKRVAELEAK